MKHKYESTYWRAKVPEDWETREDDTCVTFEPQKPPGVIQVSAAVKEAAPVTDIDLKEFAGQRISNRRVMTVKTPSFEGIHVEYAEDDNFWREWWLRSGNLMLYVTYNIQNKLKDIERSEV